MIKREIGVFLIVGILATLVDFVIYHGLVYTDLVSVAPAKATSFMIGTVFAYFSNRFWTFKHTQHNARSAPRFILLYALTMGANVLVNSTVLHWFPDMTAIVHIAFVLATGTSAVLNFIGMKFFVFKAAAASEAT